MLSTGGVIGGELVARATARTPDDEHAGRDAPRSPSRSPSRASGAPAARERAARACSCRFNASWLLARLSTYAISRRGTFGPFRNAVIGRTPRPPLRARHRADAAGRRRLDHQRATRSTIRCFAVPFGVGAALTLDESALLLRLDDVYWSEEGILSVQITLATASLVVGGRARHAASLRRGERRVLEVGGSD